VALTTYAELKTAISAWVERSADAIYVGEVDTFIDMAEAKFSRKMINHYQMDSSSTLSTDSAGETTLPADYLAYKTVIWDGSNDLPMDFVTWGSLQYANPANISGVPNKFSIRGTTLKVGPIKQGGVLLSYSATLPALTDANPTNWLLDIAPDAYLVMCLAAGHLFNEDYQTADAMEGRSYALLADVGVIGDLATTNYSGISLDMPTP